MNKFYIYDKSQFLKYWPLLVLLFIGIIVVWLNVSSLLAAAMAGAGFIFMLVSDRKSKSKSGDSIEILDKCIIFNEGEQCSSVAFNEIKKVKYSTTLSPGDPTIVIETGIGKKSIQPSDYDDSDKLLEQLEARLVACNCPIVK